MTIKKSQIKEIEELIKSTDNKRMYERYLAILHHLKGKTNRAIAEIIQRTEQTVGSYIKKYKNEGLGGIEINYSPGAPKKLTDEQEEILVKTITTKTPDETGFIARKNWTAPLIKEWIKNEFSVEYSETGTRDLLNRLGLSYTRPTYVLAKADPNKQEEFKKEFENTKKN